MLDDVDCVGPRGCLGPTGFLVMGGVLAHEAILQLFFDGTTSKLEWYIGVFAPVVTNVSSMLPAVLFARWRVYRTHKDLEEAEVGVDMAQKALKRHHDAVKVAEKLKAALAKREGPPPESGVADSESPAKE